MKVGRWLGRDGLQALEGMAADGMTNAEIAERAGISTMTLWRWRGRYPEIDAAIERGRATQACAAENALFRRAVGYTETVTEEWVEQRGGRTILCRRTVTRDVPPDLKAIVFYLTRRTHGRWRRGGQRPSGAGAPEVRVG